MVRSYRLRRKISVSPNILPEALTTVDDVARAFGIDREHILPALVTDTFVELALAPERHALPVAAGGAVIRKREFLLLVESSFLGNDDEFLAAAADVAAETFHWCSGGRH